MATQYDEQTCYRLRYEAAEQRYDRMKGLVNRMIEQQKVKDVEMEMERMELREGPRSDSELRAELAVARQKIIALELECSRLNSSEHFFENEERVRECEDVFKYMFNRQDPETEGLHSKYYPTTPCKNEACQNYTRRMRSIFRQSVAEACAKERSARVNGVFKREVEPLEKLRAQMDEEILELRMRLKGYGEFEISEGGNVDAELEARRIQLANLRSDIAAAEKEKSSVLDKLYDACSILHNTQHRLLEARKTLDDAGHAKVIYTAAADAMQREHSRIQKVKTAIDDFRRGATSKIFDKKMAELNGLEAAIREMKMQIAPVEEEEEDEDKPHEVRNETFSKKKIRS